MVICRSLKLLSIKIRIGKRPEYIPIHQIVTSCTNEFQAGSNYSYQMNMQYDFLFELLFLSIFIVNQIANATMAQPVTISRYIE